MKAGAAPEIPWIETEATVTSCRYDAGVGQAMAFGLPTRKRFVIGFRYRAPARSYTGEFRSTKTIPQGQRLNLSYNPLAPEQNSRSGALPGGATGSVGRGALLAFGIAGSVVLSLLWLGILRGCA